MDQDSAAQARGAKNLLLGIALMLIVGLGELFIVSAGRWTSLPQYTNDYGQLADGFLRGQLSLPTGPAAELLGLADPYDPARNAAYALHDAVLFHGKYYIYWGPTPAVILAGVSRITGVSARRIGDQYLAFLFLMGTVAVATVLMFEIRGRLFAGQSAWAVAPAVLSLGLGTPMLFTLARAAVYEAAIGGGQFFLLAGILAAWRGMRASTPRRRALWLLGAGVGWTLCIGSRASLAPAVGVIAVLTAWRVWRDDERRGRLAATLGVVLPLAAGVAALGWYNHARFGSMAEFGLRYQLAERNQHAGFGSQFSSLSYVAVNLHRYLVTPPHVYRTFPFFMAAGGARPFWAWGWKLPHNFGFEAVTGVVWSQPFLALAGVAIAACWGRRRMEEGSEKDRALERWLTLSLCAGGALGFLPSLTIEGSTMRYLLDVVPCMSVLAGIGYWRVLRAGGSGRNPWRVRAVIAGVVGGECILGLLMGISGYYGHFEQFNPGLLARLQALFQ